MASISINRSGPFYGTSIINDTLDYKESTITYTTVQTNRYADDLSLRVTGYNSNGTSNTHSITAQILFNDGWHNIATYSTSYSSYTSKTIEGNEWSYVASYATKVKIATSAPLDARLVVTGGYNGLKGSSVFTLTYTSYQVYSACTNPTEVYFDTSNITSLEVAPGGSATLSWNAGTDGINNPIDRYLVYRSTSQNSGYSLISDDYDFDKNTLSCIVYASTTKDVTYYYRIYIRDTSDSMVQAGTVTASLTSTYTDISAPTDPHIGTSASATSTTAYVGATGKPSSLTISWKAPNGGVNNSVEGYQYTLNGTTWTDISNPTQANGIYSTTITTPTSNNSSIKIRAKGSYANGSASSALSVTYIGTPTAPVTSPAAGTTTTVAADQLISWNAITVTGATVKYTITYGTTTLSNAQTTTSVTMPVANLSSSEATTITVTAIATAYCGGTTQSSTTLSLIKVGSIGAPTITGLGDPRMTGYSATEIYGQAYDQVKISWSAVSPTMAGLTVKYDLSYRVDGGNWTSLVTNTTTRNYTISMSSNNYKAGSKIEFYIKTYDTNAQSTLTSP